MGLTQVMLQVKGCEMVCKQRGLIPRLKLLSPLGAEGSSAFCLPPPLHPLLLLLLLLLCLPHPCPACQIASDGVQRGPSGTIKKETQRCRGGWHAVCLQKWDEIRINTVYPPCSTPWRIHPATPSRGRHQELTPRLGIHG